MDGNEQVGLVGADFVGPLLQRDPCVGAARVPDVEAARGQDRPHALGDVQCKILFPDAVVVRAGVFAAVPRIDEHRFYAEAERFASRLFLLACLAGGGRRLSFFFGRERCKVTGGVLGRIGRRVFFEDLLEQFLRSGLVAEDLAPQPCRPVQAVVGQRAFGIEADELEIPVHRAPGVLGIGGAAGQMIQRFGGAEQGR